MLCQNKKIRNLQRAKLLLQRRLYWLSIFWRARTIIPVFFCDVLHVAETAHALCRFSVCCCHCQFINYALFWSIISDWRDACMGLWYLRGVGPGEWTTNNDPIGNAHFQFFNSVIQHRNRKTSFVFCFYVPSTSRSSHLLSRLWLRLGFKPGSFIVKDFSENSVHGRNIRFLAQDNQNRIELDRHRPNLYND